MARSSVRKLDPKLRQEVDRLLTDGRHTLDEIIAHLRKLGCEDVSRSALGRYKQGYEEVAAKLRASREMADSLVAELGPAATEGKQGRLLVEILRKLTFDTLLPQLENGGAADTKDLFFLAQAIKSMSQAARTEQDFEAKIREQATAEAKKQAATEAEGAAREAGLSEATVIAIKTRILGVRAKGAA